MSLGSRRIIPEDYERIAVAVLGCIDHCREYSTKAIHKRLDEQRVMTHILASENAWLVEDAFLVVFSVVAPWWAPVEDLEIREELVLKISDGDFSCVPAFLEQRRAAEGAYLTAVGTSLARLDEPLAAKYEQHGFRREATLLIKEA